MSKNSADWWTACNCPYTGCSRLALPAAERPEGCRKCWLPGMITGYFQGIHGAGEVLPGPGFGIEPAPAHQIKLHPNRLRKCLTTRKPQRYGWIMGEPAEVARAHPEYIAACVGVALARPEQRCPGPLPAVRRTVLAQVPAGAGWSRAPGPSRRLARVTRPPRSVDELAARHAGKKPSPVEVKAALVEERAHLVNLHRCCKEHILILRQRRDECSKRLKKIDKILNR